MAKREGKQGTNKSSAKPAGNQEDVNSRIQKQYKGARIVEEGDVVSTGPASFAKPDAVGKDANLLRKKVRPGIVDSAAASETTEDAQDEVRFKKVVQQPGADPTTPREQTLVTKKGRIIGSQG
jgi:hypothetical protein